MLSGWKLLETHLIYCHVARYIKEFTQGSGLFTRQFLKMLQTSYT